MVGMVVPHGSPKPVLTCVRLTAGDGTVTVHGTDLETAVMCDVGQVLVEEPGEILVRSALLDSIVKTGACDVLVIRSTDNGCEIVEDDARYDLLGTDPSKYPIPPQDADEFDVTTDLEEFRAGVRRTEFAAARNPGRYAMTGVFLKQGIGQARLVATDGRRLACCQIEDDAKIETKGIIPPKAMRVLAAIDGAAGTIQIKVRQSQAWFKCGPVSVTTNLMAGEFPPYERIIPTDCPVKIQLNTAAALNAIRQAAVMRPADREGIVLSLSPNRLVFEARDGEKVVGRTTVPVQYSGEPMVVGFQPEYVTDALRVIGAETFDLELLAPEEPAAIRGPNGYVYVFMPTILS